VDGTGSRKEREGSEMRGRDKGNQSISPNINSPEPTRPTWDIASLAVATLPY